ncbi:hypothetical protein QJS10_CPA06g01348 [Acorus calamus]|uniref:Uncharacterized protein n=1 Tax=Acorus calamus TaxID=4465 RepID=A0AAV9ELV9_ACOCL|nr:hypothetical protein QJS10_CPA06g01348 [Acorus calamus]
MPPSPTLRRSPARDLKVENHRRGRSLESGLPLKVRDDDLTLFNEMQNREREGFLLQAYDDFDESLSKLRYLSDYKLTIPACGESSDLLNVDGDKNDYDWLLTPPDTPLFPSLDEDETPPVNVSQRGRPRSQPIAISRCSTMEKGQRSNRSSASPHRLSPSPHRLSPSPHRLSPSPRSSSNTIQSRGRPSSALHTSPPPALRPTTPSKRPSTPPNKPSTPTQRSSTPTLRRMSTGSSGPPSSSGRRGISPGKSSRGNSASPKLRAWQSSLPGFSVEAPPNLRTSISDRPASHVRGLSPVSNGRDSSSRHGRQSMSPTASRSVSSSHSHERDQFSYRSKGSVASSGDEDVDSLHSVTMGITSSSAVKKLSAFPSSRASSFSKKPSRTIISSSAPKRSFDSTIRQMDHRKASNMFRPLLSSVPPSTFYVGKANTSHRPMISRTSSHTTSSNASSEQGGSIAPDMEGSEPDNDVLAGDWRKMPYSDAQEEVFIFDRVDEMNEDGGSYVPMGEHEHPMVHMDIDETMSDKVGLDSCEKYISNHSDAVFSASTSGLVNAASDHLDVDSDKVMYLCTKCGKKFQIVEALDGNINVCQDCAVIDELLISSKEKIDELLSAEAAGIASVVSENGPIDSDVLVSKEKSQDALHPELGVLELPGKPFVNVSLDQCKRDIDQDPSCSTESCHLQMVAEREQVVFNEQLLVQQETSSAQSDRDSTSQGNHHFESCSSLNVDNTEGTGISVLLKGSSSNKWPVLQGRSFTATTVTYEDPSYARDGFLRSSLRQYSSSASSSVDLSSSRNSEVRFQRQLSIRSTDAESSRKEQLSKPKSIGLSLSGNSVKACDDFGQTNGTSVENFDESPLKGEPVEEALSATSERYERALENEDLGNANSDFMTAIVKEDMLDPPHYSINDAPTPELMNHVQNTRSDDPSAECLRNEDHASGVNADHFNNAKSSEVEVSADTVEPVVAEEDTLMNNGISGMDGSDESTHSSLLENDPDRGVGSNAECVVSPCSNNVTETSHEHSLSTTLEKDALVSALESNACDSFHSIQEESTVTIECPGGQKPRSLTLEEATDTILFCSSIVHDLAYKAASIAIEKESQLSFEPSRLTVTTVNKPLPKDSQNRSSNKRTTTKIRRTRQKRLATDMTTSSAEAREDVKIQDPLTSKAEALNRVENSTKPPKLESKCNCTVM